MSTLLFIVLFSSVLDGDFVLGPTLLKRGTMAKKHILLLILWTKIFNKLTLKTHIGAKQNHILNAQSVVTVAKVHI